MDKADFSGYATKAGLKCSDGRTITPEAFKHMDGLTVPLVWQHAHDNPENVLGHGILEAKDDGMIIHGFFNGTSKGKTARALVEHKDIRSLSIYANALVEKGKTVLHGMIREVSLVMSGANPGAVIQQVRVQHSADPSDTEILADEAVIFTGLEFTLVHSDESGTTTAPAVQAGDEKPDLEALEKQVEELITHSAAEGKTVGEVYNSMTDEQKLVCDAMFEAGFEAAGADNSAQHTATGGDADGKTSTTQTTDTEGNLSHQEGTDTMTTSTTTRNVFEQNAGPQKDQHHISHSDLKGIVESAVKIGSFKAAFEDYALAHSIEDIDLLFPDAKQVGGIELIKRRTEWVASVLDGAKHSPFSRIKSLAADLTADEARAKGYVKGNLKKEEIVKLLKRVTTPTTIYKKQKLDRDDIIDITDLDVVLWLKAEMRLMLEEELARAVLIGDGREPDDEDKIDEDHIRPIAFDDDLYAHKITVPTDVEPDAMVESILRSRKNYKGTGTPTLFTTDDILTDMLLIKDRNRRRMYNTEQELAAALRVDKIVVVEVMEDEPDLLAVLVNMQDYTIGADRGGEVSLFDDFDIDYNQYKYLIETRASGCLTKPKSALVLSRIAGNTVAPLAPAFNQATNTLTVPAVAGVTYFNVTDPDNAVALPAGDTVITETTDVEARPNAGNNFPHNTDNDWTFAFIA